MKTSILAASLIALITALPARAGDYQVKNKSQFTLPESVHNPFWPIGWVKPALGVVATPGVAVVAIQPDNFSVTSISLMEGAHCAVINGKVYSEGEAVAVMVNSQKALVRIVSIRDSGVVINHQGQAIKVPFKRKEDQALNRAPVEPKLSSEQ